MARDRKRAKQRRERRVREGARAATPNPPARADVAALDRRRRRCGRPGRGYWLTRTTETSWPLPTGGMPIVAMWPNVPWDTMEWAIPLGMGLFLLLWVPISRVVWLSIDVMVRPVQASELE